jgi:hypothetical protein
MTVLLIMTGVQVELDFLDDPEEPASKVRIVNV